MIYYHVVAKVKAEDKEAVLFTDLDLDQLKREFLRPYNRGKSIYVDNEWLDLKDLRQVWIIKTALNEEQTRTTIFNDDMASVNRLNANDPTSIIISPGTGYDPLDLLEAGEDVTLKFLNKPPGERFKPISWILRHLSQIAVGVIIALLVAVATHYFF